MTSSSIVAKPVPQALARIIHTEGNGFTADADAVLREGAGWRLR